jgi:hypothetical protein
MLDDIALTHPEVLEEAPTVSSRPLMSGTVPDWLSPRVRGPVVTPRIPEIRQPFTGDMATMVDNIGRAAGGGTVPRPPPAAPVTPSLPFGLSRGAIYQGARILGAALRRPGR